MAEKMTEEKIRKREEVFYRIIKKVPFREGMTDEEIRQEAERLARIED